MKTTDFIKENELIGQDAHNMHQDHQHQMLREECYHIAVNSVALHKLLKQLPEHIPLDAWAAEKISLANDYIKTVKEWLEYDVMGAGKDVPAFDSVIAESKLTAALNEVNPHNYDSDEDYYNAVNAPAKRRSAPSDYPYSQQDDDAYFNDIFRKKRLATKKSEQDKDQGVAEDDAPGEEAGMASSELFGAAKHAKQLLALIRQHGEHGLEAWQQSKITKAADYLNAVLQSMDYESNGKQGVAEGEFTIKDDPSAHIRILFLKTINGNEYRLVKQGNVYKIYINSGKKQVFSSFDLAKKALQQLLLNAVHTDDPVVAEGFPDDILAMAKKVSPNARIRGSRDEEIARRDAMLAQRAQDHANAPEPKGVSDDERASLEAELQQLMPKYDRHYQMIDNYTQHMQAKHIADRVHEIQRKLKPGVAEGWDPEDDEQWSAEDPKDEMFGAGDAYKRGIQDYRKFMQTKVKPSNPYSYTKQARQADNWEKGFEDGRYKQGMSEGKGTYKVYCSQCSNQFTQDKKEGYSHCKDHSPKKKTVKENATGGGTGASSVAVSMTQKGNYPAEMVARQQTYSNQRTKGGPVKVKAKK